MLRTLRARVFPGGTVTARGYFESETRERFRLTLFDGCLFAHDHGRPVGDAITLWIAAKHPGWLNKYYRCLNRERLIIACNEITDWIIEVENGKPEPPRKEDEDIEWLCVFYFGLYLDEVAKPIRDTPSGLLKRLQEAWDKNNGWERYQKRFPVLRPGHRLRFKKRLDYYVWKTDWLGQVGFKLLKVKSWRSG